MFKFFAICLMAVVALAAAKPGIVAPVAYSAYSSPLIAASPYTAAYTAAAYSSPLIASPYVASPYVASPYASAYSAYPYAASASLLLRR